MTDLTYEQLVQELFPRLSGGIRWGPERTQALLAAAGRPHRRYQTLHVAGTNGKGSVCATLASILGASRMRTGLYTSPHLCSLRERIQIDGRPIGQARLLSTARALRSSIQQTGATFFEATTAIAFSAFAAADVDVAVIECGLGGRLDATNVVTPCVTAITNISVDHTEYLGTELAGIAREKAGIMKPGIPVVTAETDAELLGVLRERAAQVGAPFRALPSDALREVDVRVDGTRFRLLTERWGELELHTPLIGRHQARNVALAVFVAEQLPSGRIPSREAVIRGISTVRWPGRLQVERVGSQVWIFDAAHNPAGAAALMATLTDLSLPRPRLAVLGILADKDWRTILPTLAADADDVILTTPPSVPDPRRWDPVLALGVLPDSVNAEIVPHLRGALLRAWQIAGGQGEPWRTGAELAGSASPAVEDAGREPGGTVLVSGSAHTVGDALSSLGRTPWGLTPDIQVPTPTLHGTP